ncbi:uncharacterized protein TNCV_1616681 [Trichonephila clavipes]|nr:uncharacterized protein TNCV_1616681 [Trichonephila clavipes]
MLLARWIIRSVPLEIVGSSGHEKVPTCGKPGLERSGRPRGERHLVEANLKSKRPFHALPLTPEHRELRLQWYQARSMWNVTDWQNVVFSDESRFVLGTDDNRVWVWRRPGSSPVPLKTRCVGQRCTLNLSRAETSSRWCGVVVRRGGCQLRCRPRHLTMVQNYVVRRQKPSCS